MVQLAPFTRGRGDKSPDSRNMATVWMQMSAYDVLYSASGTLTPVELSESAESVSIGTRRLR